jgi:hypothetical protein
MAGVVFSYTNVKKEKAISPAAKSLRIFTGIVDGYPAWYLSVLRLKPRVFRLSRCNQCNLGSSTSS